MIDQRPHLAADQVITNILFVPNIRLKYLSQMKRIHLAELIGKEKPIVYHLENPCLFFCLPDTI